MAESFPREDASDYLLKAKSIIDRFLPVFLILTVLYLYIEFFGSSEGVIYGYKTLIQYSILFYFSIDVVILFILYEDNKRFFRNHWLDIMMTIPFLTAFKGLKGLKLLKPLKTAKIGKGLKFVKISQKLGKIGKKSKKLKKKYA